MNSYNNGVLQWIWSFIFVILLLSFQKKPICNEGKWCGAPCPGAPADHDSGFTDHGCTRDLSEAYECVNLHFCHYFAAGVLFRRGTDYRKLPAECFGIFSRGRKIRRGYTSRGAASGGGGRIPIRSFLLHSSRLAFSACGHSIDGFRSPSGR